MSRRHSRREFIKQTSAIGVGAWIVGPNLLAQEKSPNERLRMASVGVGGKGSSDCDNAAEFGDMVALCDIDDNILEGKAKRFPEAKKYNDFRKMLEEMGDKIDAVTVSTPDHTHAPAAMMAIKMKKHVYVQKPLTHTVFEARALKDAAKKYGVCTQMGNQGTAENGLRRAVEIIRDGVIGPVKEIHVWTNRPVWPQAPRITARPEASEPPAHVHWDLWLGPAAERPYSAEKMYNNRPPYHDFNWRGWWDFGTGALGDMACHTANMAFMALKLGMPTAIVAEVIGLNPETYPEGAHIVWDFPARESMPAVKFNWYEGKKDGNKLLPPLELLYGEKVVDSGSVLVGEKGVIYSPNDYGAAYKIFPAKDFEGYKGPEETLPRNGDRNTDRGMKREWTDAIKANKPEIAMSNFDYAATLTEAMLLGNIAIRANGKKLEYDGAAMKFSNAPEMNQYLHKEYRKGWTL
jgi:predicted dehydrogenase